MVAATLAPGAIAPRGVALSRDGRWLAGRRQGGGVELLDGASGDAGEGGDGRRRARTRRVAGPRAGAFGFGGDALWVVEGGAVGRRGVDGASLEPPVALAIDAPDAALAIGGDPRFPAAIVDGARPWLVRRLDGALVVEAIARPAGGIVRPLGGRHVLAVAPGRLAIESGGRIVESSPLPGLARVREAAPVLDDRAVVVIGDAGGAGAEAIALLVRRGGGVAGRVRLPTMRCWAIAEATGALVVATADGRVAAYDVRHGAVIGEVEAPFAIEDLAVDARGEVIAIAGRAGGEWRVRRFAAEELFARGTTPTSSAAADPDPEPEPEPTTEPEPRGRPAGPTPDPDPEPEPEPEAEAEAEGSDDGGLVAIAIGPAVRVGAPTASAEPLLETMLDGVAAAVTAALAGRKASDGAILKAALGERAALRARAAEERDAARRAGERVPLDELAADFCLSERALDLLVVAAAPRLRADIARAYGILLGLGRPAAATPELAALIADDAADARRVADELRPDRPLIAGGLLRLEDGDAVGPLFAALACEPTAIDRLRGDVSARGASGATVVRTAAVPLAELAIPTPVRRAALLAVARPPEAGRPLRLAVIGRPGRGRTSLVAALAARRGRAVAAIDVGRLTGTDRGAALARELLRARVAGHLPCLRVDALAVGDAALEAALVAAVAAHPGPLAVAALPERPTLLAPGHAAIELPAPNAIERRAAWSRALARRGLRVARPDALAARLRLEPGTIERVLDDVAAAPTAGRGRPVDAAIARAARGHLATRIGRVAERVERLATWDQLVLPDDTLAGVHELIDRVRVAGVVLDDWGLGRVVTTARGVTALFAGPPGVGKTMVAGVIARELGLELYRVDLAAVASKWIGETEKNLAAVFDAAETGQVVVLFDEADSLFGKRTEVKSSTDRYANLEVNYLLQRLDSFEGVALLTTNREAAIDPAFLRRLSLRLSVPPPTAALRRRLWQAHLPAAALAEPIDVDRLADGYELSGGHIRNCALRAAYLAAGRGERIGERHLRRAIELEYRDGGHLIAGGRLG